MRVLFLIDDASVFELDVEVLINRMQRPFDGQIVLQLHDYFPPHQILEVREEQLPPQPTQFSPLKRKSGNRKQKTKKRICTMSAQRESKRGRWETKRCYENLFNLILNFYSPKNE